MQKPSIPKGTRDFSPIEMAKRNYIFDTIKDVFKLYGYAPIETPAMENLSTLLGKYGEEGDKLLFKILNSGDFLNKLPESALINPNANNLGMQICKKGLRYDLTVPFARYVVQHRNEIDFPFKRYQIQPVWRADRPQKGRYQEFYQCDADVIGSNALLNELELAHIINDVFERLNIKVILKLNNRKILAGIADYIGYPEKLTDITIALDKIEKIGTENVIKELEDSGISKDSTDKIRKLFELKNSDNDLLVSLKSVFENSEIGKKGIEEMNELNQLFDLSPVRIPVEFDLTLARGLNYYTGTIFEVKATEVEIGSICGGGRYDDLTGIFGLKDVSGVGISFGADRIYDVLNQLERYPEEAISATEILFVNFGEKEQAYCLKAANETRKAGIRTEIYPSPDKLKKQMIYANNKNIPFVILVGEEEIKSGLFTLKNMQSGEQQELELNQIIETIKS